MVESARGLAHSRTLSRHRFVAACLGINKSASHRYRLGESRVEFSVRSPHPRRVSHLSKAREVFDIELGALRSVRRLLDESFDHAVDVIMDALGRRGKV